MATSGSAQQELSVSDVVAIRLKEARGRRGWTAEQLAEQCANRGAPKITTSVINNMESGRRDREGRRRRDLTVDEVMTLAFVLDVAPIHLMGLPEDQGQGPTVRIAAACLVSDQEDLLLWIRGDKPLPDTNSRLYYASALQQLPEPDSKRTAADFARTVLQDRAKELLEGFNQQTAALAANASAQMQQLVGEAEKALAEGASPEDVLSLLRKATEG